MAKYVSGDSDVLVVEFLDNYAGPEGFEPAHAGDAGVDLYAAGPISLPSRTRGLVQCGIKIKLPLGHEGQIRSKSGLALKQGLMVLNSPGTIDEGYRGELGVIMYNSDSDTQQIVAGQKVAQLVIAKYERPPVRLDSVTEDSVRGSDGFGSTDNVARKMRW